MASKSRGNSLLESIPIEELGKISRELELVPLDRDAAVLGSNHKDYVYFPTTAVISFLGDTGDHRSIEVWSVGHEGIAGISNVLGYATPFPGVVQVPGEALRIKATALRRQFQSSVPFRQSVFGYVHYLLTQVSYLGICNNIHPLTQRLSRWLLIMEERVGDSSLHFTQETIASLLGTRRATISVAAAELQASGAISYTPGAITIRSRRTLKCLACTCYRAIRVTFRGGLYAGRSRRTSDGSLSSRRATNRE
jgi:hypothetical protein